MGWPSLAGSACPLKRTSGPRGSWLKHQLHGCRKTQSCPFAQQIGEQFLHTAVAVIGPLGKRAASFGGSLPLSAPVPSGLELARQL